jgi:plasmid replication initiation protein
MALPMLVPERHPVRDFFVLDVMDVAPRSDVGSMEHPFFTPTTQPDTREIAYEHNGDKLQIIPSIRGLPTIFDKDILIYCISKLIHAQNEGREINRGVRLTAHDLLVATNRPTNNLGYERLGSALERLRGVTIKTTIRSKDEERVKGFGLIDAFEYNRKGSMWAERLQYCEVVLSDWLFRAVEANEVLPISREYFRIRSPVNRRLYELARKHCGQQPSFRIGVDTLQKKTGSRQEPKHFRAHLRGLITANDLPDYHVRADGENVLFERKAAELAREAPALRVEIPPSPAMPRRISVSMDALQKCPQKGYAPGWDKYQLEKIYIEWAADKEPAKNEDARFLSWVKSFTKGKPPA